MLLRCSANLRVLPKIKRFISMFMLQIGQKIFEIGKCRPMASKATLQTVYFCLGLTTVLYCIWILTTDSMLLSGKPVTPFGIEAENYVYIILDYTADIEYNDYLIGNCLMTKNRKFIYQADAVVFTTRKLRKISDLPKFRKSWQRWVWHLDESPHHSIDGQPFTLTDFNNVYNWTMTYRTNSDVYIPYGWTQRKLKTETSVPDLGSREKLVAAVISNCNLRYVHNSRMEYIKLLEKNVPVTLYGGCGIKCEGYVGSQVYSFCPELSNYLFYLAFENSNCKEYITEKMFANAFESGAVPVVLGAPKEDYTKIAPPNSFIHVRDFESPKQLGEYLEYLAKNKTAYRQYHVWRKEYATSYRIQYVSKSVWKPLCEKLNNNDYTEMIIPDLNAFWTLSDCNDTVFW